MSKCFTVFAIYLISVIAAPEQSQLDQKAIQGEWKLVASSYAGKDASKKQMKEFKGFVIRESKMVPIGGGPDETVVFVLRAERNPKEIDVTHNSGEEKGKTMRGIYALTANRLQICMYIGPDSKERPKDFDPNKVHSSMTLERQK